MKVYYFLLARCIVAQMVSLSVQKHGARLVDIFILRFKVEQLCMDGQTMIKS